MKVILLKDTPKIGKKGQLTDVSDGYAHNFLIPKGFAAPATVQVQQKIDKERREAREKSERDTKKATALKEELEKRTFTVKVKVGDKGQIFGGVREKDIAHVINAKVNTSLDKHHIRIGQPIREVGGHVVTITIGPQVTAEVKINIEGL